MPTVEKLEGVSGKDKICSLYPIEVLEVIDHDDPIKPDVPEPPTDKTPISIIDWIIKLLEWLKSTL